MKAYIRQRLIKLEQGAALEVLTYKRNRGFIVMRLEDDHFRLREHGYHVETYEDMTLQEFEKMIDRVIKREFPRSQSARIYTHDPGEKEYIKDHFGMKI